MLRILLVADEPWVVNSVESSLSDGTFEISHCDDPAEVVSLASELSADVVVADMQVGSKGGMAITRAVRDAGATGVLERRIPVVLLLDRPADAFLARRSGAEAWVIKPFNSFELRGIVERLIVVEATDG